MMGWPKLDADLILYFEIILMSLFLLMNATDLEFQNMNNGNVISGYIYLILVAILKRHYTFLRGLSGGLILSVFLFFLIIYIIQNTYI